MKTIRSWNEMAPFGIIILTSEACGLMYRVLFDVTEKGRKVIGRCFGIPNMTLAEPWNRGTTEDPHVGSIMFSQEALIPVGVFALLENGCSEVYIVGDVILGIEPGDPADTLETMKRVHGVTYARRYSYGGTAGDRNTHVMSGRVE